MAKDTVEDSRSLDASSLARGGWLRPGTLGASRWTRAGAEIGSIGWLALEGGLQLIYTSRSYWTDETTRHDYVVPLVRTQSPVGGVRTWFLCPRCERRVRKVYLPPVGRRFACRGCHDLAYQKQHQSRTHRALDRLFSLADRLGDPALSAAQAGKLGAAFDAARASPTIERLLGNTPVRTRPRRGPGRPSKRELRDLERAERRASRPAVPTVKRPKGRPKEKRTYVRRQPSPPLSAFRPDRQAYCVKCRDRRELARPRPVTLTSGRAAIQGRCRACGTTLVRILPTDQSPQDNQRGELMAAGRAGRAGMPGTHTGRNCE